jgi:crotonobetainyl-CoA:carnitine CoA-transferase CaiB-like acyl-CoA transferase
LDFGLAIAGPYGPQILADLGATVIKVTSLGFSLTDAIYVGSSQGKRVLAVDLKDPRGREISHRLIERADVVHHNMRPGVAERLGIDYATACRLNSKIIYCHTRGFERDGPRSHLPGNDQMGNALAGTEYEGGGTHHGTPPIWHATAFGDTANGVASANAVIQALAHRDRTGRGQFVHTSILNVCMLFNSSTFARPDGSAPQRARIDADQFGFSALRRLYETASGWLCLYLRHENDWMSLCAAIDLPELVVNDRFGSGSERASNDAELVAVLSRTFAKRSADEWFSRLDTAGVPCEISSPTFAREALADPALRERGWVIANPHPHLGHVEQVGMPFSFSESSAQNLAGAPITGQHSREILTELGYTDEEIDALIDTSVVLDGSSEVIAP